MSERHPAAAESFDARTHYRDDAVARGYDDARFGGLSGRILQALERRMILRALRVAGDVRSVIDLPAGTGRLIPPLQDAGYEVIGADISAEMLARAARRRSRARRLLQADGASLPLRDGAVDAIVSLRLFPHLPPEQRIALLSEMARVARVGVVAVYQPDRRSAWHVLRNVVQRKHLPRHFVAHSAIVREAAGARLAYRASFSLLPGVFMERAYVFAPRRDQR
jgi:SAM-dependent methyltransferase